MSGTRFNMMQHEGVVMFGNALTAHLSHLYSSGKQNTGQHQSCEAQPSSTLHAGVHAKVFIMQDLTVMMAVRQVTVERYLKQWNV